MALTSKRVEKLLRKGEIGRYFDGAGLYCIVTGKGTGNWQRRYELGGRAHWAGLSSCAAVSLSEARLRNRRFRELRWRDPLARSARRLRLAASAVKLTFQSNRALRGRERCAGWTPKHAAEHLGTLQRSRGRTCAPMLQRSARCTSWQVLEQAAGASAPA
jgi:hypothetical protein